MKNINQIFKNNKHLMDETEVIELVDILVCMKKVILNL